MVNVTINGIPCSVEEGTTILDAAASVGIEIPTLCYLKDIDNIGACRVCCVEVEGSERLMAACNTPVEEGMVVLTDSERAEAARKLNLELLLSRHDQDCDNCLREGTCKFQTLVEKFEIADAYDKKLAKGKRIEWNPMSPIQRDTNKCIQCGRCVQVCKNIQDVSVWDHVGTGKQSTVAVRDGLTIRFANCTACGQCITHCPTAALTERDDVAAFKACIEDPEIVTVVQIAPATRTAWASALGFENGEVTEERMCAALKAMGVDYVFDTNFAADLTIMEEGTELIKLLNGEGHPGQSLPLFTSCCPGWTSYAKSHHPDIAAHLSTAKSPMMMQGAVTKTWFAEKMGLDPAKICSVALMPCTAKKVEIKNPQGMSNEGVPDMDFSLTTREFVRLINSYDIDIASLEDADLDSPLGTYTGAGVIFGTTGGVMEAALRTAYFVVTGQLPPDPEAFEFTPSEKGPWVEAEFDLNGVQVRCATTSGLSNTRKLIEAIRNGEVEYEFVEIMACPSGCAGGGGQPIDGSDRELGLDRGKVLRDIDRKKSLRYSHENPEVQILYSDWLGEPCSELAEKYLHVHH